MDVLVNVANQKLKIATNLKSLVAGTQEFVRFVFNLAGDWDNLMTFAQFSQNGVSYNQYLDDNNSVYLPSEIGVGTCTLMLYGSGGNTIATTNYLTLTIDKNILVSDAKSTEISESLYNQLVTKVNALLTWNEQNAADLIAVDKDLQQQINTKANATDLQAEITRAKQAETTNANAIATKASQADVDELSIKVTELESNEVVAQLIEDAVKSEITEFLNNGTLANLTITDGSITRSKVDSTFEDTLAKADSAMQPSVYDPQNLKVDIFSYAQGRADIVQNNLNTLKTEVQDAYVLTDTMKYTNLGDAIRGAVTLSRTYAQALLADYKAFTISIVDELPLVGNSQTFYLVPKDSGSGYDKYWYITNSTGDSVWDIFGGSSTLVVTELPIEGEADTDYILKTSSGCLYYKWIDGVWEVVAGSLAYVASTLPDVAQGNEFTDYYVVDKDSGSYIHYRFVNGSYHVIGGDSYTKDEINSMISTTNEEVSKNTTDIGTNTTNISSLSKTVDKIRSDVDNIDTEGYTYYHTITKNEDTGNYVLTLYQVKGSTEEIASQTTLPSTGGGSGSGTTTTTTVTVDRVTASPLIITTTDSAIIEIDFSATDSDGETIDATYTWKSGSTVLMTGTLAQGRNSFDLSEFVSVGTQKFTLTAVDEAGTTVVKSWTVQKVDVRIESSFSDRYTTAVGRSVSFTYTPYGAVNKTVHFKLDGVEETVSTSASGTLQSYTIPAQAHGSHLLEVWITATINSVSVETSHIYKDIMWYNSEADDSGNYQEAVIGCIYRNDYYGTVTARQYDTTAITYNVFDPTTNYPTVMRYVDGELIGTDTISTSQNVWNFKSDTVGEHTLKIVVRNTTVTIVVNVTELGIDVSPITGNLEIDFNPTGITNSSTDRVWSNDKYAMSVSDNFDWANGGYKTDENGDTYFLVKAGTSASFNYLMFDGGLTSNPSVLGAEMKIVFMTENVQDANAVWLSNVETTTNEVDGVAQTTRVGIQMGVHEGWLKTNSASDTDVEGDENTDAVAATNTYLYMPYSEEDIIEMDINIDTLDRDDSTAQAFVMAYEDGVPSKAYVYDSGDRFYQYNPQPITIGSDYCDVRIYRLKIYSASLSTENIMRNFIADSRDSTTMLARYDRNSIYYNKETNTYTPYSGEGSLDPEKLAPIVPNVKILMLETDHFTTSKKTFVKAKLRCIHASGGDVYAGDPYYDNWLFENGYHSGQGTTSDNYGNAGRNVDFLFNCDGVHKPSDKVKAEDGYISQVTLGYGTENATTEKVTDWKGDAGKVDLTRTSVPNNFYNLKVNIASSENVNNALLQKRYNDFLPYISPAKKRDSKIKNDMEFVPAILFLKETNTDVSTHNEFLDTEWHK